MNSVEIRYFGMIKEIAGKETENIESVQVPDVGSLRNYLLSKYPALELIQYQVAVNRKLRESGSLNGQDEIVLLPPYSGG